MSILFILYILSPHYACSLFSILPQQPYQSFAFIPFLYSSVQITRCFLCNACQLLSYFLQGDNFFHYAKRFGLLHLRQYNLNHLIFTQQLILLRLYSRKTDMKMFTAVEYSFNYSIIFHYQPSFLPDHVLLENSLILSELAFCPVVCAVATAFSLYKSAFKSISVLECFFSIAVRKVIQPFAFICITFINEFAFSVSFVLQDCPKIVRSLFQYKQALWTLRSHLAKITLEIRFILKDDFSKPFRISVFPSAFVVGLIGYQLIKAILVKRRRLVLVRRFQFLINRYLHMFKSQCLMWFILQGRELRLSPTSGNLSGLGACFSVVSSLLLSLALTFTHI